MSFKTANIALKCSKGLFLSTTTLNDSNDFIITFFDFYLFKYTRVLNMPLVLNVPGF